jgi:sporulation protein YlmC with PRC-barrel domain
MDISTNAKVNCSDGPFGQSTRVIIKPTTQEITHLVVSNESFLDTEYLVSIDLIAESTPDQIRLNCTCEELSKMPIFDQVQFVPSAVPGFAGGPFLMWPFYVPAVSYITLENEHIPFNELAIRRGARVEATDGHIGRVDEFLIDPTNDSITHLVMREGHLWGQKDVTIPVSQIDHYEENTVYLKLTKEDIEKLPGIPVLHSWETKD